MMDRRGFLKGLAAAVATGAAASAFPASSASSLARAKSSTSLTPALRLECSNDGVVWQEVKTAARYWRVHLSAREQTWLPEIEMRNDSWRIDYDFGSSPMEIAEVHIK